MFCDLVAAVRGRILRTAVFEDLKTGRQHECCNSNLTDSFHAFACVILCHLIFLMNLISNFHLSDTHHFCL